MKSNARVIAEDERRIRELGGPIRTPIHSSHKKGTIVLSPRNSLADQILDVLGLQDRKILKLRLYLEVGKETILDIQEILE